MPLRPVIRLLPLALLGAGTLALAQQAGAPMYKWTDENGRVTYSDQPPVGKVRSQETLRMAAPTAPSAAQQMYNQDAQFKKRQEDEAKKQTDAAKKDQLETVKRDNCTRARGELRALRDNIPVVKINEAGDRVPLDEATKETEAKRIEAYLEENCANQSG